MDFGSKSHFGTPKSQKMIPSELGRLKSTEIFWWGPKHFSIDFYDFLCVFVSKTVKFEIFVLGPTNKKSKKSKKMIFSKIDSRKV